MSNIFMHIVTRAMPSNSFQFIQVMLSCSRIKSQSGIPDFTGIHLWEKSCAEMPHHHLVNTVEFIPNEKALVAHPSNWVIQAVIPCLSTILLLLPSPVLLPPLNPKLINSVLIRFLLATATSRMLCIRLLELEGAMYSPPPAYSSHRYAKTVPLDRSYRREWNSTLATVPPFYMEVREDRVQNCVYKQKEMV